MPLKNKCHLWDTEQGSVHARPSAAPPSPTSRLPKSPYKWDLPCTQHTQQEQRSARRYLQVEKVNISLWGPVACFWTQCSVLAQAGVPLLDFSAARGVAFPNLCAVPAWKSPGNGFGVSSWRVPGWPFGYYFHLHCSHMPADYYWMCKACCWLQLAGNWVWLESIF